MALIAHWPLDGRLDDVSGNGYHLKSSNPVYANSGHLGKCLDIKRSTNSPYIKHKIIKDIFNNEEYTISFWLNQTTLIHPWKAFLVTNTRNFRLEHGSDNYNAENPRTTQHVQWMNIYTTGNGHLIEGRNTTMEANKWYLVSITRKGNVYSIYFNGVKNHSVTRDNMTEFLDDHLILGSGASAQPDDLMSDLRIYDTALVENDFNKIMKEPCIDLDFKGSIPPTVNWLDNTNKVYKYNLSGGSEGSILTPNKWFMKKVYHNNNAGFYIKPPYKKFVLSFKIRVISGTLSRIGGHAKNNNIALNSEIKMVVIDDVVSVNKDWISGIPLEHKHIGESISVELYLEFQNTPVWDEYGLCIQPNRLLNESVEHNVECEIFDVQVEEGAIATPFCTWSRDYMQIPDKSSYRDSIQSVNQAGFGLPSYKLENNKPLGSKGVLTFDYNNALKLDNIPPLPKFSTSMVFTPTEFISTDVNNGQMSPIFSIAKFKSSNTDPKRFSVIYNTTLKKLTILYDNNSADCVIDRIININETVFIVVTLSSEGIIIYINGTKFSTNITNPIGVTTYDLILGKRNPNTVSSYKFELSDFKMHPYIFTDEEVANEYKKLKNRVKSMSSAFANIPTLNVEVPRLWENNPNTIGINCFSNNPNIPQTQTIPIGWGGEFKQPDVSILTVGTTTDMLVINPEEVIYIDPFLDSVPLHTLSIEDTQTNTESTLILTKKSKF